MNALTVAAVLLFALIYSVWVVGVLRTPRSPAPPAPGMRRRESQP